MRSSLSCQEKGCEVEPFQVLIDSAGQLGTVSSSARFKEEIEEMGETSGALLKLRPVTFRYKGSQGNARRFGLIAEEVEKVLPELVVHAPDGEAETVLYHEMPAMLVNELQKQQKQISDQQRLIEHQVTEVSNERRRIEALEASLAELQAFVRETLAIGKR